MDYNIINWLKENKYRIGMGASVFGASAGAYTTIQTDKLYTGLGIIIASAIAFCVLKKLDEGLEDKVTHNKLEKLLKEDTKTKPKGGRVKI